LNHCGLSKLDQSKVQFQSIECEETQVTLTIV